VRNLEAARLQLPPTQVHLWIVFDDDLKGNGALSDYRQLLSEEERQQETRFHFERHRRQYVITRALVRTVLSRYADIAPQDWLFTTNAYGRPTATAAHSPAAAASFNVSHTERMIICGVASEGPVGVDVEYLERRLESFDIAKRYFSPDEVGALHETPMSERSRQFYYYWTLKESYIKAKGQGLSIPLDQFSFHFSGTENVRISIQPGLDDVAENWRFWLVQPSPEHVAAICARRTEHQELLIRRVVPLETEELFETSILKQSI
jgi:4'-phosphopantetheinyl transferase